MKISKVKEGEVVLIAGGGKVYTDIAAKFVRTEKDIKEIIASDYDANLVNNIIGSGHLAVTEFDYFLFGVQGYSRVTEIQLARKRMASYCFKSGRMELNGKREGSYVIPKVLAGYKSNVIIDGVKLELSTEQLVELIDTFYTNGVVDGQKEEDMRYIKPQATEFKGIIGMNAHALLDWFKIRCCKNAQEEIRDMALKMLKLCKASAPDLFKNAGPNCVATGFCTENARQHNSCKKNNLTMEEASELLKSVSAETLDKMMRTCNIERRELVTDKFPKSK